MDTMDRQDPTSSPGGATTRAVVVAEPTRRARRSSTRRADVPRGRIRPDHHRRDRARCRRIGRDDLQGLRRQGRAWSGRSGNAGLKAPVRCRRSNARMRCVRAKPTLERSSTVGSVHNGGRPRSRRRSCCWSARPLRSTPRWKRFWRRRPGPGWPDGSQRARPVDRGLLRAEITLEEARDVLWTYSSPELYELLVIRRGWPGSIATAALSAGGYDRGAPAVKAWPVVEHVAFAPRALAGRSGNAHHRERVAGRSKCLRSASYLVSYSSDSRQDLEHRPADGPTARPRPQAAGRRDPRVGHRDLQRQDRDPDREPDARRAGLDPNRDYRVSGKGYAPTGRFDPAAGERHRPCSARPASPPPATMQPSMPRRPATARGPSAAIRPRGAARPRRQARGRPHVVAAACPRVEELTFTPNGDGW